MPQENSDLNELVARVKELEKEVAVHKENEEKFRNLLQQIRVAMIVHDSSTRIVECNRMAQELLGLTEDQMLGKTALDPDWLFLKEDGSLLPLDEYPVNQVMSTRKPLNDFEVGIRWPGNREIAWVLVSANPLFDEHGDIYQVHVTFIDITERRHAQQKLEAREVFLDRIISQSPFPTWIADSHGTLLSANLAVKRFLNVTDEQLVGKYNVLEDPIIKREGLLPLIRQVFEEGKTVNFFLKWDGRDIPHLNLEGSHKVIIDATIFPIHNAKGELTNAVVQWFELTEKTKIEEALKEANTIINKSPSVAFKWKNQEGWPVEYVSENVKKIFGYSMEEFQSGEILYINCIHPDDIEKVSMELTKFTEEGLEEFKHEPYRIITKEGLERTIEDWTFVEKGIDGEITYFKGIVEDITERIRANYEKEKLESQLMQAQKMESVGRLAGGVAHDFNNMLTVILGNVESAMETVNKEDPLYEILEQIEEAGQHSAELTRQLLAFARRQTISPKIIDLNEIVANMLVMLKRLIGEDIDLVWKPGEKLWQVSIDISQVDQMMANLCVNSRDAIENHGTIIIETQNAAFDEEYCIENVGILPGEYVMLSVYDNGCGMDTETKNNVFEPFFTTKDKGKGTGLGLSTVYGIVKQNNGFINLYSEPGKGTNFKLYLPRYGDFLQHKIQPVDPEAVPRGYETILLVEDEPGILRIGKTILEKLGYNVLAAGSPGQAIEMALEYQGVIHLLITDVVMPEMNGRELAAKLLSFLPDIKRLFMSGYPADVIAHHGVLDEGVNFLQKPFTSKSMSSMIRRMLEKD